MSGGVGGGLVGGASPVVASDDLAQHAGGLGGSAALGDVDPAGGLFVAVLVVGLHDRALEVHLVGVAAAGHRSRSIRATILISPASADADVPSSLNTGNGLPVT